MIRLLLLFALTLIPAAASAGIRATYVSQQGPSRIITIADNGDIDATLWMGDRLLVVNGRAYIVQERLTGPLVTPLDELDAALIERAAPAETRPRPAPPALTGRDGVEVNGRIGRGYFYRRYDGNGEEAFAVISSDQALARIGGALRQVLDADVLIERLNWQSVPPPSAMNAEQRRILASGAPIQVYFSRLQDVEQVAVPAVALPAAPETGAQVRARLTREAAERDAPVPPEWDASRVLFADGRLWLVAGNQRLMSLAEGEPALTRHDLGDPVLDACVQGGEVLALTGPEENARSWTLRRLHAGRWQTERTIARVNDGPLGLACTAEGAFLLTGTRFIDLTPARPVALRLSGQPIRARVGIAVHVTPQAVFVGLNSGEWGGGLRRIDRRSGRVETVERNATGGLCDGPLNTDCDPVHGIATIPWRTDCVAVAIGLIHMLTSGRITSVCRNRIEQLYVARGGDLEAAAGAPGAGDDRYGTVAFFGLAATGSRLLAIGDDGLYRIAADGTAAHVPLPRFVRVEGLLVSFALPDVVLVTTGINARASVSGAVPIMAVRQ